MSEVRGRILVADDEENVRNLLGKVLRKLGFQVDTLENGEQVLEKVRSDINSYGLLLMDIRMPKLDGMEAFKILRLEYPNLPVILMTAFGTVETTLETMRLGAFDYLTKPFELSEIKKVVEKVFSNQAERVVSEENSVTPGGFAVKAFIGNSPSMQDVFKIIGRVSSSGSSILIQGESGTGKELVARTIHQYSDRKNKPFVTVNCGAIPEGILESEFFGHEKGAFTGAIDRKIGKFEFANEGTLFLDEIGEMSPQVQVKLLRVLQEREFERVGGNETVSVNVRVIAASNKNLREGIDNQSFRADLYYRLNVVSILMPPLRERKEDISLLAAYFRDRYMAKLGLSPKPFSEETVKVLEHYSWPGNVRELENAIEHALVIGRSQAISVQDLPGEILAESQGSKRSQSVEEPSLAKETPQKTLKELVKGVEKEAIARTLKKMGGNKSKTAKLLDVSRRALQYKIEEYGLTAIEGENEK